MRVFTAPETVDEQLRERAAVFLAGSIEMGKAKDWQLEAIDKIGDLDVAVFNPRRAAWDSTWVQSIGNPVFTEQVNWELDQLWRSDVVFFYFQGGTQSPITLMELGYMGGRGCGGMFPVVVACDPAFWRRGNVEIMCAREGFRLVDSLEEGLTALRSTIEEYTAFAQEIGA